MDINNKNHKCFLGLSSKKGIISSYQLKQDKYFIGSGFKTRGLFIDIQQIQQMFQLPRF